MGQGAARGCVGSAVLPSPFPHVSRADAAGHSVLVTAQGRGEPSTGLGHSFFGARVAGCSPGTMRRIVPRCLKLVANII